MACMGNLFRQLLAAVLCLMVLLPPGWCCYVGGGTCCEESIPKTADAAPAPCDGCSRGCCCPPNRPASAKPAQPKSPRPIKTCCCCQKYTADRPKPSRGPAVVAAPALLPTVVPMPADLGEPLPAEPWPIVFLPPLHLVHCVWLC